MTRFMQIIAPMALSLSLGCGADEVPGNAERVERTPASADSELERARRERAEAEAAAARAAAEEAAAREAAAEAAAREAAAREAATAAEAADGTPSAGDATSLPTRLVAFGDLHGDLARTRAAFAMAGLVRDDAWVGGDAHVVQVGDQLDRGAEEGALLRWLDARAAEARTAGGRIVMLLGNHEVMNAMGDMRYVAPEGLDDFDGPPLPEALRARVPEAYRARVRAFLPGAPEARRLARQPVLHIEGDTVFVHGGVTPSVAAVGASRVNATFRAWLEGSGPAPARGLLGPEGPLWVRDYALEPDDEHCADARRALALLGVSRMVVGHTVQRGGVGRFCDGAVIAIDVGLSRHYGGPLEGIEVSAEGVRVLRESP